MKNFSKLARAYALKNALAHDGKSQPGAVISGLFNEGLKKEDVKKYIKDINKIVSEVNKLSAEKQEAEFSKLEDLVGERPQREGLPELPNVKGKGKKGVIMRFAPSASGPLHVGHALTASISFLYVQKYRGTFYVRIEDTNPENIYPMAYDMIAKETSWLFPEKFVKIAVQSDNIPLYYKYAEKLIKKKAAYVCTCIQESFREFAEKKQDCPCRGISLEENLERWKKMLGKGKTAFKEGDAVLRFKTQGKGMKHENPAMRDFPLARINLQRHARQGKKYRVWPLMNLAVAVDDIESGMTHIIRAKDHRDNAQRQKMIYEALGLGKKFPWVGFLGRIKFTDMDLSTTKFRKGVETGEYKGWDDSKLPTIAALKKSYKPEAFWKFAERIGLSENDKVIDKKEFFQLLDTFNRE